MEKQGLDDLNQRMQSMEEKFDTFFEETKKFRETMCTDMKEIRHVVVGSSSTIGLMERVRGLEKVANQVKVIGASVIMLILNAIKDLIVHK